MAKKSRFAWSLETVGSVVGVLVVVGGILWFVELRMSRRPAPVAPPVTRTPIEPPAPAPAPAPAPVVVARQEPAPEPMPVEPAAPVSVSAPAPPPVETKAAPARAAAQILAELRGIARQAGDNDQRRATLIGELYQAEPTHRQIPSLLIERWITLKDDPAATEERHAAQDGAIGASAAFVAAYLGIEDPSVTGEAARGLITAYSNRTRGKSPATAELLGKLADEKTEAVADQRRLYRTIVEGFPGSPAAERAMLRLAKLDQSKFQSAIDPAEAASDPRIGQPFLFSFRDAVSGQVISSDALRGHVLVVDFWATWCPPCVASVPHLKEMYARYAPQGVVFLGVSHDSPDQAGLRKLLNFVDSNEMPWAQFHQTNSELSKPWGVSSIPTVFVIDQEGRVVTTRGNWDQVIPKLLGDPQARKPGRPARKK